MASSSYEETEIMTGSQTVEFAGYSITEGIGSGKCIKSQKFTVGGYDWEILFYPKGKNEGNNGYISLYLKLVNPKETTKVKALYDFKFLDKSGKPNLSTKKTTKPCIFDSETPSYGFLNFVEKTELEASDYLIDDALHVRCLVWVFLDKYMQDIRVSSHESISLSNLATDLGNLLETGDTADVTFVVNGKSFPAHKCVLVARSPVFKEEFGRINGPMSETVTVENMDDNTFSMLLNYIYTDSLPVNQAINGIQCLIVAADRYKIENLKLICEKKLCDNITPENVATRLGLAEQHNCPLLKNVAIEFAVKPENFVLLMLTEGFFDLQKNCPSIVQELKDKVANPTARREMARQMSLLSTFN